MDVGLVPGRETHNDDSDNEELVDVGLVPGREIHDDDSYNEELVDVGLVPGRETHNDDWRRRVGGCLTCPPGDTQRRL